MAFSDEEPLVQAPVPAPVVPSSPWLPPQLPASPMSAPSLPGQTIPLAEHRQGHAEAKQHDWKPTARWAAASGFSYWLAAHLFRFDAGFMLALVAGWYCGSQSIGRPTSGRGVFGWGAIMVLFHSAVIRPYRTFFDSEIVALLVSMSSACVLGLLARQVVMKRRQRVAPDVDPDESGGHPVS